MREIPLGGADIQRRRAAAERHLPRKVRLLVVTEAPPRDFDRYFYFPDAPSRDSLFSYLVKGFYGISPDRGFKRHWLNRLTSDGIFVTELCDDADAVEDLADYVPALIERCRELRPEAIVLIKATVYDVAFRPMIAVGLPVLDRRISFPGSGHQQRFEAEFAEALSSLRFRAGRSGMDRPK